MAEVVAVLALDARPISWLGALARLVALLIAVAAAEDPWLRTFTRDVALLLAVVACPTSTTPARRVCRLRAVGLVVTELR
jgi:hypothetical protein